VDAITTAVSADAAKAAQRLRLLGLVKTDFVVRSAEAFGEV
jgi:cytochrome c-type biogenesis protein CcmE